VGWLLGCFCSLIKLRQKDFKLETGRERKQNKSDIEQEGANFEGSSRQVEQ